MAKINIDKVAEELLSIQNQINTLEELKVEKKQVMAAYFDRTGTKECSNKLGKVYIKETTNTVFDVNGILKNMPKEVTNYIVEKEYKVENWEEFVDFMKSQGIKGSEIKQFFTVTKKVDKDKVSELYDKQKIKLEDIKPYMQIKFTKSVVPYLNKKDE